jgi:hypothetical protein
LPSIGTDYDSAVLPAQSLTERFDPAVNKDMEICEFRQITQSSGETLNEFYRRLKEKASTCEFANEEAEIRTQIIHKTSDAHLRRKALRDEPDLKALLQCGLTLEQSDRHSKLLEEDKNTPYRQINFIKGTIWQERQRGHNSQGNNTRYNAPASQVRKNVAIAVVLIHTSEENPLVQPQEKSVSNVGKWVILENIACRSNDNKHAYHVTINNSGIIERAFVVCQNTSKLSDTDEEFIYTIIASTKPPKQRSRLLTCLSQ